MTISERERGRKKKWRKRETLRLTERVDEREKRRITRTIRERERDR